MTRFIVALLLIPLTGCGTILPPVGTMDHLLLGAPKPGTPEADERIRRVGRAFAASQSSIESQSDQIQRRYDASREYENQWRDRMSRERIERSRLMQQSQKDHNDRLNSYMKPNSYLQPGSSLNPYHVKIVR